MKPSKKNKVVMAAKILLYKLLFWAAMGFITLSSYSCSEPASPFGQTDITLTTLDASCTEVWLELKFSNLSQPADVAIQKDGKDYHRILSLNRDTLLVFEDLEPSTNYSFRAIIRYDGNDDKISNTAEVRTMDTTNHSFTWEVFEFGEGLASSAFYDFAYISENDIWVVGEIYYRNSNTFDSLGRYILPFNAAHWNGETWKLVSITYVAGQDTSFGPLKAVFASSSDDVLFGVGNMVRWNGSSYKSFFVGLGIAISKIWSDTNDDIYIIGQSGKIGRYSGGTWKTIPSGTEFDLHDINSNSEGRVLISGSLALQNIGSVILQKNGTQFQKITTFPATVEAVSVAPVGKIKTLTAGEGVYQSLDNMATWKMLQVGTSYTEIIRARAHNQIVVAGHFSSVFYFNGVRWIDKNELGIPELPRIVWQSISINDDGLILVGFSNFNDKAIILRGKIG